MPPDDEPQPPEHQRQAVAAWLERELARIDRLTPPDPGRVTARRLNRAEYNNTIRDLLGVDLRPADDFPQDDSGYGFDNIGDVLSLSPALMEKYLTAAERVARTARVRRAADDADAHRGFVRRAGATATRATFPAQYDLTGLSLPNAFHAVHRVPVGRGLHLPRRARRPASGRLRADHGHALGRTASEVGVAARSTPKSSARFDDDRQDFGGQALQFRMRLSGGRALIWPWRSRASTRDCRRATAGPNPSTRPRSRRKRVFNAAAERNARADCRSSASGSTRGKPSCRRFRSTACA